MMREIESHKIISTRSNALSTEREIKEAARHKTINRHLEKCFKKYTPNEKNNKLTKGNFSNFGCLLQFVWGEIQRNNYLGL